MPGRALRRPSKPVTGRRSVPERPRWAMGDKAYSSHRIPNAAPDDNQAAGPRAQEPAAIPLQPQSSVQDLSHRRSDVARGHELDDRRNASDLFQIHDGINHTLGGFNIDDSVGVVEEFGNDFVVGEVGVLIG
jgi:hypothetical protein